MQLKIHSVNFDAEKELEEFIQAKTEKLEQFDDSIVKGEVFLKLDNNNGTDNKMVEIKLHVPGNDLFAKKSSDSFEKAFDEAVDAVGKQVKKHNEKLKEKHR